MKKIMALFLLSLVATLAFGQVVRYVEFKVYDPVYVAYDKGFFDREGVKVEFFGSILGGPGAIQAVASGAAEAGLSNDFSLISAVAQGIPVIGVTDIQSAMKGQPLESYYVRADSDITTLPQMLGKKWAVNMLKASFYYTAIMQMEKVGLHPDDVTFVTLPFDKQIIAIDQKQVDMVSLMEPYASYLEAQGKYRKIFDANDTFGTKQFTLIFLNSKWASANPVAAKAFVTAVAKACDWMNANQTEAGAIIARHTGIPAKFIKPYYFQNNGKVVMEDVQFWIDYMVKSGDIAKAPDIGLVATNSFNRLVK
jgi:NitT/TauT family transport system substrate-binding protein